MKSGCTDKEAIRMAEERKLTLDHVYKANYILRNVVRQTDVLYAPKLKPGTEQGKNAGQGSGICSSRNRQQQVAATSEGQIPQTEAFHRKAEQGQWP